MEFTYEAYENMIKTIKSSGYKFYLYNEVDDCERFVILRHDVDFDLDKAVELAQLENKLGVNSTYFILVSTNFYNAFSKSSIEKINRIKSLGHKIGLHFDEQRYKIYSIEDIKRFISYESKILSDLLDEPINVVSMHRPSKLVLENDIELNGLINSYSPFFFKKMKYVSDSRMHWRENVMDIITCNEYDRIHILTHSFWYSNNNESIEYKLKSFLNNSVIEKYNYMNENFKNLDEFISKEDLLWLE